MEFLDAHRALLSRLLPDDDPGGLAVREGQFYRVVLGTNRVVCLPRTEAAADRLPARAAVLRTLAGLSLGFRTPEPLAQGVHQNPDDPRYLVLSRIPGAPLEPGALHSSALADAVAKQYAVLLAGLADAGSDEAVRATLPHAPRDQWQQFAADVRAKLFALMSDTGRLRAEREVAALDGLPHRVEAVVHGDLGAENALWESADGLPRLSGVVDWDEVALGDPAEDLAAIGASYGDDLLARVLALGGRPNGDLARRITTIRGTFALQQALAAHRDGDEEELTDGLTGYR
ncbi:viomycin phosphotransferase [Streptomyces zagrosensis]|uniref:Aminoglycoside phosphotransferase (APT) family kinase protein n=1 Tax=Streptomyces zagrosensis TaxID=1042984 RepID=A0A7W9Q9N2_9ACTN|nr:viomycin phosphotransferase [Streptomyces zagrosensis]MBB5935728.1 aminoglycoside phosphotransferase (APT) family kinase protein [Streptomyces zagrosensis]